MEVKDSGVDLVLSSAFTRVTRIELGLSDLGHKSFFTHGTILSACIHPLSLVFHLLNYSLGNWSTLLLKTGISEYPLLFTSGVFTL